MPGHRMVVDLDIQVPFAARIHPWALDMELAEEPADNMADTYSEVDSVDMLGTPVEHQFEETALQSDRRGGIVSYYDQNLVLYAARPASQLSETGIGSLQQSFHCCLPSLESLD